MASFVLRRTAGRLTPKTVQRWASAAAVPMTESPPYYDGASYLGRKDPEDVKVTRLSNGVTVASLETHSYSSSLSFYVRAGSRFETYSQQGLTHMMRKAAFLAAGGRSTFRVVRELDHVGGSLSAANTRENVIYRAQVFRGNDDLAFDILSKAILSPDLNHWEIRDLQTLIDLEVTAHENNPESAICETLHQAAFRNALSNSLFTPRFNLGHITASDLREYMDDWFVGKRITLVGIGVDHQELVSRAESSFSSAREGSTKDEATCQYYGGGEVYTPSRSELTHAAIVSKGASLTSEEDILLSGVLQHLMGTGESVKWGGSPSRLVKAGSEAIDTPFNVRALNMNYSDNGLFGFSVISVPRNAGKLLQALMYEFTSVAKGNVSDAELTRAKNQFKAKCLMEVEQTNSLSDNIAAQVGMKGDYTPLHVTNQKVDSITKDAVVQFAKNVFATRSTMVARGNLSATPHMQQLVEGVSLR